jgi:peptidoglycan/LPS O-acetylase OafA/YrhL
MATAEILPIDRVDYSTECQHFYRPELDGLRFCAFLAVYICHSIPNGVVAGVSQPRSNVWIRILAAVKDAGNFGVCLFFMLSAFLITELLRREQDEFGSIHIGSFYLRRMLRIWPLYFGITIAYAVGGHYFSALRIERGRIFAYFLLAGNWYIALHPWIQTPLRSLWSISVEEQFYLIWPLLARCGGMRLLAKAAFMIVPISFVAIMIGSADKTYAYNAVWLSSFTQFQFFAWGGLLSLVLGGRIPKMNAGSRAALGLGGVGLCLFAAYASGIKRPGAQSSAIEFCLGYLLVAAGCLFLLLAVLGMNTKRIPAPMISLGKISFGLYVFHETAFLLVDEAQKHSAVLIPSILTWSSQHSMIALLLNKLVALGATVVLAILSYRFWEKPFLRLKSRVTWIQSRSI